MAEPEPPLNERNFIQEVLNSQTPIWIWLGILFVFLLLIWGIGSWSQSYIKKEAENTPFLQVTNRDFSVFLWDNPEFMRVNSKTKRGYLSDFDEGDELRLNPVKADDYVLAPPELIFRYHVWNRLVSSYTFSRPIPADQFSEFLKAVQEWQPQFWQAAPAGYEKLVQNLKSNSREDLQFASLQTLPLVVRKAFWGWKNYYRDGDKINALQVNYQQLYDFLSRYPRYQRSYWRNILDETYPNYLMVTMKGAESNQVIPADQIAPFLKVALYNSQQ